MKNIREGYKITELGEIPEDWEVKKIEDVAEIVSGGTPSTKNKDFWDNGDIYWSTPTDITSSCKYISKTKQTITHLGLKYSSTNLLPIGSILMTSRATIGARCINTVPMCTNQGFKSFVCREELNNEFMYYMIDVIKDDLISLSGGSTFLEISKTAVANYKLIIPPLKEQEKISLILSLIDEQIEITNNFIEKTKELRKGLMQKLLTKGIGNESFKSTEIGRIPKEWKIQKIKDVSSFCSNGFVGTASPFYTDDNEGIPYLMSNNVRANKIDERSLVKVTKEFKEQYPKSTIYEGDMLTVQSGHIGTSCVVPQCYNNANCHALIITRFDKAKIEPLFVSYYINSSLGLSRLSNIFVGTTIKHVNVKDLIQFYIPVPPLDEQKQIVSILSSVDEQINQYESKKEKLQELKKGLMQKLLTGKVRVKV